MRKSEVVTNDMDLLLTCSRYRACFVSDRGIERRRVIGEEAQVLMVLIDLKELYGDTAKLALLPEYVEHALQLAGEGEEVVLTGAAPVWLYLKVAHALHGKARRLLYRSPVTGDVVIFDHDPF
jgi:hypothetical protein